MFWDKKQKPIEENIVIEEWNDDLDSATEHIVCWLLDNGNITEDIEKEHIWDLCKTLARMRSEESNIPIHRTFSFGHVGTIGEHILTVDNAICVY